MLRSKWHMVLVIKGCMSCERALNVGNFIGSVTHTWVVLVIWSGSCNAVVVGWESGAAGTAAVVEEVWHMQSPSGLHWVPAFGQAGYTGDT